MASWLAAHTKEEAELLVLDLIGHELQLLLYFGFRCHWCCACVARFLEYKDEPANKVAVQRDGQSCLVITESLSNISRRGTSHARAAMPERLKLAEVSPEGAPAAAVSLTDAKACATTTSSTRTKLHAIWQPESGSAFLPDQHPQCRIAQVRPALQQCYRACYRAAFGREAPSVVLTSTPSSKHFACRKFCPARAFLFFRILRTLLG